MNTAEYEVEIADQQTSLSVDRDRLCRVVRETLEHEQVRAAQVSVAIVDGPTMRRLNADHLQHDFDTDVLSFLFDVQQRQPAASGSPRGAEKSIEGEVIVNADMALQRAAEFHWSPQDELVLYVVHGLLHLVGYDDLSPDEKRVMRSREQDILSLWQLVPRYTEDHESGNAERSPDDEGGRP